MSELPSEPQASKPQPSELEQLLLPKSAAVFRMMKTNRQLRHAFIHGFVYDLLSRFFPRERFAISHPSHSGLFLAIDSDPLDGPGREVRCVSVFQTYSAGGIQDQRLIMIVVAKAQPHEIQAAIEEATYYLDQLGKGLSSNAFEVHGIAIACDRAAILVPGPTGYQLKIDDDTPEDLRVENSCFLDYLRERASIPFAN